MLLMKKIKDFFIKYWKYIASSVLGLILLFKVLLKSNRQKQAFENEVESNKKIIDVIENSNIEKQNAKIKADDDQKKRDEKILRNKEEEVSNLRDEFESRIKDSEKKSLEETGKQFADTFGAKYVEK